MDLVSRNKARRGLLGILLLAALASIWLFLSPWWAVSDLKRAFQEGDGSKIDELVDYTALWTSVKRQASRLGGSNDWIDLRVAQPFLGKMVRGEKVDDAPDAFQEIARGCMTAVPVSERYESFSRFSVTFNLTRPKPAKVKLLFARSGISGWQLTGAELPDLVMPLQTEASAAAAPVPPKPRGKRASTKPKIAQWAGAEFQAALRAQFPKEDTGATYSCGENKPRYIDLDGDDVEEILVECLYTSKMGNWGGVNLVVFKVDQNQKISRWGEGLIGQSNFGGVEYPDYDTLELPAGGRIVFDTTVKGPLDPSCCPSRKGYSVYRIKPEGTWVEVQNETYPESSGR